MECSFRTFESFGSPKDALEWLRRGGGMSEVCHQKALLANGLWQEAFLYMHQYGAGLGTRLQGLLLHAALEAGVLDSVLRFPFTATEAAGVVDFLSNAPFGNAQNFLLVFLLLQRRYEDALKLQDALVGKDETDPECFLSRGKLADNYRLVLPPHVASAVSLVGSDGSAATGPPRNGAMRQAMEMDSSSGGPETRSVVSLFETAPPRTPKSALRGGGVAHAPGGGGEVSGYASPRRLRSCAKAAPHRVGLDSSVHGATPGASRGMRLRSRDKK